MPFDLASILRPLRRRWWQKRLDPLRAAARRRDFRFLFDAPRHPGATRHDRFVANYRRFAIAVASTAPEMVLRDAEAVTGEPGFRGIPRGHQAFVHHQIAVAHAKLGRIDLARLHGRLAHLRWQALTSHRSYAHIVMVADPAEALEHLAAERSPRDAGESAILAAHLLTQGGDLAAAARRVEPFRRLPEALLILVNIAAARRDIAAQRAHLADYFAQHGLAGPALLPTGGTFIERLDSGPAEPVTGGPLVSVIVPVHNAAATLRHALESVLKQAYRNLEILVIDDASSDDGPAIVAAMAQSDRRIRSFKNTRNLGAYASRNIGIQRSAGAYITFQDADDWSHPERLNRHVRLMEEAGGPAASLSSLVRLRADGSCLYRRWGRGFGHPNMSSMFLRRAAVEATGAFDPVRFDADSEYAARIRLRFGHHGLRSVPLPLCLALVSDRSLTGSAATGENAEGYSAPRSAYRQAWVEDLERRFGAGEFRQDTAAAKTGFAAPDQDGPEGSR